MTADIIAEQLLISGCPINLEFGLIEEAKAFRGKSLEDGPLPVWDPLILPTDDLLVFSNRINVNYKSILQISHIRFFPN